MTKEERSFSAKRLRSSFKNAFAGIGLLSREKNFRVQLLVALVTVIAAISFGLGSLKLAIIILCIGAVLAAEGFNTAIETLCDALHPERSEAVRQIKDIAAGSVLILSLVAVCIGVLLFLF